MDDTRFDQTMQTIDRVTKGLQHSNEHVVMLPVKTKHFDSNCEMCKLQLEGISKKSDNRAPGQLNREPLVKVSMTTVLCSTGIHDECMKNYVIESEIIKIECTCKCHAKVNQESMKKEATKRRRL